MFFGYIKLLNKASFFIPSTLLVPEEIQSRKSIKTNRRGEEHSLCPLECRFVVEKSSKGDKYFVNEEIKHTANLFQCVTNFIFKRCFGKECRVITQNNKVPRI